jgi:hypothetical protein
MSKHTEIPWCDSTLALTDGCSAGCEIRDAKSCWAERYCRRNLDGKSRNFRKPARQRRDTNCNLRSLGRPILRPRGRHVHKTRTSDSGNKKRQQAATAATALLPLYFFHRIPSCVTHGGLNDGH